MNVFARLSAFGIGKDEVVSLSLECMPIPEGTSYYLRMRMSMEIQLI